MRLNAPREFYMPRDVTLTTIRPKGLDAIAYTWEQAGKFYGIGFAGKAQTPSFHYSFRTPERRAQHIAEWITGLQASADYKAKRKAEKKAFKHSLKVGDILRTSWGYDQTNIEYFEVTRLIGETMVEVREIGQERETTAWEQGECVPSPGQYIGKPRRHRVLEGNILDIHGGFGYARLVPAHEIAGAKVYPSAHWTSYA